MGSHRTRRASLATAALCAVVLGVGGCATGAPKDAAAPSGPSSSAAVSSSASTSAPASEESATPSSSVAPSAPATTSSAPSSAAPTTSEAPKTDQPTVVYTKAATAIGPGENLKVTITVQTPNPGVPHGDVTLLVDGVAYASATLNEAGSMAFTVKGLAPGDHSYQGVFAGNAAFVASQSTTKKVRVKSEAEIAEEQKKKEEQAAAAANNPCPTTAEACVDLTSNTTWLQKDGVVTAGPFKQIAGRAGHRTPTGTFTVQWKNKDHKSQEFNQAPMPYAIFFTTTGIAFHVGSLSNPSHGCIHLSEGAAKTYWEALTPGDVVYVFGSAQY